MHAAEELSIGTKSGCLAVGFQMDEKLNNGDPGDGLTETGGME